MLPRNLCLNLVVAGCIVVSIPPWSDRLSLPLDSFSFSSGRTSRYESSYIHFVGNDGAQYSLQTERSGYYSIVISAVSRQWHSLSMVCRKDMEQTL